MKKLSNCIFIFNTLACFVALGVVIFTISVLDWKPCPMCLLQQLCVLSIMLLSLLVLATKKFKSFSTLLQLITIIVIATGAYIAADQVYLQYFLTDTSNNNAACGAINNKFLLDATKSITGTINSCTDISEKISGVSLTVYSFIFFISLLIINCINFLVRIFKK
ncbi:disulfide bond formation protein B [Francisella tularensis]|uniref:disulfide bond formation protein B n=1 Tax=Francisella tularensis TaxID=263 RepID=UPI0005018AD6|nr:disulfide bond formation protein B [Francisella tularensis]AJI63112.1 disulfide bond formation DsbB family protein [Francisella tularensis subsp. tularensis]KFJ65520.1 disulfide bond formation DsbB family protein [Francisella tularensis]MBK2015568.1 disulfide bond formation protein B [Francisella tularensis subsp. tularensis]MBK2017486.1 disulfide bond formation protein B [Francisella tularensis subsp. tularensis]MBK2019069.1 disulfide bond formation protein B [Francisella tularensis subsp.